MLSVKKIICGELKENCYIISDLKTLDTLIIDPGCNFGAISKYIDQKNLNVCAILLTHGHYDHIGACKNLQDIGYKIAIHELDADKCTNNILNLSNSFSEIITKTFTPDILLFGDEKKLQFGSLNVTMLHTPGHSEGSCCYVIGNYLFSGDTVFDIGYGRTDFYDGNGQKLRQSIRKLSTYLIGDYVLCAGH